MRIIPAAKKESKPQTKVVHRTPKSAQAVIDAAADVVASNGKPVEVVKLAEALNKHQEPDVPHNPFGVVASGE